jgi:hypothetical protein
MRFDIEAGGTERSVQVERQPDGRFRVVLDGHEHLVDAQQTDAGWSLIFEDGRSLEATATPVTGGEWRVQLPHVDVPVCSV